MKLNLFVLLVGVIVGSAGTLMLGASSNGVVTQDNSELSEAKFVESPQGSPERTVAVDSVVEEASQNVDDSDDAGATTANLAALTSPGNDSNASSSDFDLAEPYASMVRPREQPKVLKTPELFERFVKDRRDNSWADSMEAGMRQIEAAIGAKHQTAFDSVECRSRYCIIAGVSYSSEPRPWSPVMLEMSNSGWWQGAGGASISATTLGSETHFLAIISRESSDTLRDPGIQTDMTSESGVNVAQLDEATR